MRSSVFLLGSLLPSAGVCRCQLPGGLHHRSAPVDLHVKLLRNLGAELTEHSGGISARAETLRGCRHRFPRVSVGATENGILAAVLARGETVLENCAREPEIFRSVSGFCVKWGAFQPGRGKQRDL